MCETMQSAKQSVKLFCTMREIDWPMAQTSVLTTRETRLVDGTTEIGEDQDVILDLGTCLPTRPASHGPNEWPLQFRRTRQ